MSGPAQEIRNDVPIQLFLLGGFRAEREGQCIPEDAWQRRMARSLVKLLATQPSHKLHREQIADALWPDQPLDAMAGQFRKTVHFARHALEPDLDPRHASSCITVTDDLVALDTGRVLIDVDLFETEAADALATADIDAMERACARYTGDLLPEDRYEDWTVARREALSNQHRALLLDLANIYERRGALRQTTETLRRLLYEDPAQEEVHRRLMRLAAASGSRHEALRQYQACRTALRQVLDTDPGPETEQLYREMVAGRGVAAAPVAVMLPGAVRRQPAGPLIGREAMLHDLRNEASSARAGEGRAVLLRGEMGVGKSRLLAEFARTEHGEGAVVLWGAAYEQEGQLPYAPFAEALDSYVVRQPAAERARLTTAYHELSSLIPSLGKPEDQPPELTQDQRPQLFAAIVRILAEVAGDRPLLLVLDDLHAADRSSLQLLHHLARVATGRRWLIVGAHRDDTAAGSDIDRLSTQLSRSGLAREITLPRLTRPDCALLLAGMLEDGDISPKLLDELYTHSLGNALFAHELMRELIEHDAIVRGEQGWVIAEGSAIRVPRETRELVGTRLDRLGSDALAVLTLAATAGLHCSYSLLRDAAAVDEAALLNALDFALAAHVIEERDDGYVFVHPVFRATLYERLSQARRSRLHAALAGAIEARGVGMEGARPVPVETLAYHWIEAGEPERAVPCLIGAADHAAQVYASTEAIGHLHRALELIDTGLFATGQASQHRTAIYERLGELYALAGEAARSRAAFGAALATGVLTPTATARVQRHVARLALAEGDLSDAGERLTSALRTLEGETQNADTTSERLRVQVVAAEFHFLANRFAEALALAEECINVITEEDGSDADLARALEMASMACLPLGQWQRGLGYERQHARLSDLTRFVRDISDVHFCFGEYHIYAHRPAESARIFMQALAEAERLEAPRSIALCHYYLGVMNYFRGRFRDAMSHLSEAIVLYQRVESPFGEAIARMIRGTSLTAIGQLDAGRQEMERGLETAHQGTLRSHALIRLYAGLCRNRLDANDAVAARHYAEQGLALAEEPSTCICYASFLPAATAAFAISGDLGRAAELGERALQVARGFGSPAFLCMAQQANAMVAALSGSWEPAFVALDDARSLASAHDFPYELARTLLLQSFVHLQRRGRRDLPLAAALMAEASPILARLGVRTSAAQLRSSLGFLRDHAGKRSLAPG